jgi:hypothetical protein
LFTSEWVMHNSDFVSHSLVGLNLTSMYLILFEKIRFLNK